MGWQWSNTSNKQHQTTIIYYIHYNMYVLVLYKAAALVASVSLWLLALFSGTFSAAWTDMDRHVNETSLAFECLVVLTFLYG